MDIKEAQLNYDLRKKEYNLSVERLEEAMAASRAEEFRPDIGKYFVVKEGLGENRTHWYHPKEVSIRGFFLGELMSESEQNKDCIGFTYNQPFWKGHAWTEITKEEYEAARERLIAKVHTLK